MFCVSRSLHYEIYLFHILEINVRCPSQWCWTSHFLSSYTTETCRLLMRFYGKIVALWSQSSSLCSC